MEKILKGFAVLFMFTILFQTSAYSANELFRSQSTGPWNLNSTWQMSTNGGSIWFSATSTPTDTSGAITIQGGTNVSVTTNVSANQLIVNGGGTLTINTGVTLTVINGSGDDLTLLSTGIVTGAGTFQTQGVGTVLDLKGGSTFSANLKINTGSTTIADLSSPYNSALRGSVTIDAGAILNTANTDSYHLHVYGTITNNGTITGTGGANLRVYSPSFVNNGAVTQYDLYFDSTTAISGAGTFNIPSDIYITDNGNVSLLNNVTFSPGGTFQIQTGGTFSANGNILTFNSGEFNVLTGGTVVNSGTIRTQNNIGINPRTGSNFNANINVATGITTAAELSSPYNGRLRGNITIDPGATLSTLNTDSYHLNVYGSITNNGTVTGTGGANLRVYGPSFVNNGVVTQYDLYFDSTTAISGTGTFNIPSDIYITDNGNVSLLNNVTFSPGATFEIQTGGTLSANGNIFTFNSGTFNILTGGTVVSSGTVRTQNNVSINPRTGSNFNANLNVASGTTIAAELSSPYNGRLKGNVTVDAGAILSTHNTNSYNLYIYGSITNNGTITGTGGSNLTFFGPSMVNNGSVTSPDFFFDSTTNISGTGTYTGSNIFILNGGSVTILNNVTFSPSGEFEIQIGGTFSPNGFIFTFNSGIFTISSGGTVVNSGSVKTQNSVYLNPRNGSNFNANLTVASGTTIAADLGSPYIGRLRGNVTVDAGATLNAHNTNSYNLNIFGIVTNNGTITGTNNSNITFLGPTLINNGTVSTPDCFFDSTTTVSGTGAITTDVFLLNGAIVTMGSNHQFLNINIAAGSTFITGSNLLKFTASNPIIQNGTLTSAGSKIEYNGSNPQNISTTNITYYGLRINNPDGTTLLGNVTVNDTLSVILGDIELDARIITLSSTGLLTETPGNTIKGNTGYITTTRSINAPGSLNVGGLGAVLTTSSNLGSTEIRRGHGVQTGGSIRRYFDVTPTNNSGLNATLTFKFDESELNFRPEPTLKLKKSTNGGSTFTLMGGTLNAALNEITLTGQASFSRWTADSSGVSAVISMAIEGFYNAGTNRLNMTDTVRIYLRNTLSPYGIVDSSKTLLDSAGLKAACVFVNAPNGIYYIQTKHRNALETWSRSGGESYSTTNTLNFDFMSSAPKAFGDNQVQVDASPLRFAIYSGDILQDGVIDGSDGLLADNAAANFEGGYVVSDVNGDRFVDGSDASIVDNNAAIFVSVARP